MKFLKVTAPVTAAPVSAPEEPAQAVPDAPVTEPAQAVPDALLPQPAQAAPDEPVPEVPASEEPSRAEEPVCAFPAAQLAKDEDDVCNLWEIIKTTHSPAELLAKAQGLMASLPDVERRKNLCGILIADYLDPEYCPVTFLLQETLDEPAPEDIHQSMLEVQLHAYALETWHILLVNTKKRKPE